MSARPSRPLALLALVLGCGADDGSPLGPETGTSTTGVAESTGDGPGTTGGPATGLDCPAFTDSLVAQGFRDGLDRKHSGLQRPSRVGHGRRAMSVIAPDLPLAWGATNEARVALARWVIHSIAGPGPP